MISNDPTVIAVSIGNTRIAAALYAGDRALAAPVYAAIAGAPGGETSSVASSCCAAASGGRDDAMAGIPDAADLILDLLGTAQESRASAIVIASVNEPASQSLLRALEDRRKAPGASRDDRLRAISEGIPPAFRLDADLSIPQPHTLGPNHTTGQDRLLNALAAFHALRQACIIIDAGTAITVDFVDGEGVYHGGAIAPGARMQLRALHDHTAALPLVDLSLPDEQEHFAKTTAQAMLTGVCIGARGMVRALAEHYAEAYGGYPRIIATGGDAELLFSGDDLVEHIVPDLTLRGVALAAVFAGAGAQESDGS